MGKYRISSYFVLHRLINSWDLLAAFSKFGKKLSYISKYGNFFLIILFLQIILLLFKVAIRI